MASRIARFSLLLWFACVLGAGAAGAALGLLHSAALAVVAALVSIVAVLALSHNWNPVMRALRKRDDRLALHLCEIGAFSVYRQLYRRLPADPRCRVCLVPFGGVGKLLGIRPSRKNTNLCTECMDAAPVGVHDMEAGILHADLRGFTAWSETQSPSAVSDFLSSYYSVATRVLCEDDALIECVGDQVMAIYLPAFPSLRSRTPEVMVRAAARLIAALDSGHTYPDLNVGVGIHIGIASVGNIAKGSEKDFTAAGDVVNTAARLQAGALAGQIVVSPEVARQLGELTAGATRIEVAAKGKSGLIDARALDGRAINPADV